MAETIRDVVIRLALKQVGETKLVVDTSEATKAQEAYGQVATGTQQDIVAAIAKAAEAAAEATKKRIEEEQAIAAAAKAAAAEQRKIANDARRIAKEQEQAAKALAAEQARQAKLAEDAAKAQEAAARKVVEQNLKAGDAFKTAGEGAFTLLRGITLLGVAGEKDMQKVVQAVAQVQGAFDVFKGGFDLYKGITEGARALGEAQKAAAVASTALAAGNTAVGASATGAAAGLTAMQVAAGPVGAILLTVGAAAVLVVSAFRQMADAERELARIENEAIGRKQRLREVTEQQAEAAARAQNRAGLLTGPAGIAFNRGQLSRTQSDLDLAARQRLDAQRELQKAQDELLSLEAREAQAGKAVKGGAGFVAGLFGGESDLGEASRARARVESAKQAVGELAAREKQALEEKLRLTLDIGEAEKKSVEQQKQATQELQRQADEQKRLAEAKQNELLGLQRSKEERELRFGALSGREKAVAKQLSEKEAAGTLTEAEARRLEELLGRTTGTRETLLGAARAGGSDDVVSRLGTGEGTYASELERIRRERDAALEDARSRVAAIEGKAGETAETLREIGDGLVRSFDHINRRIDDVNAVLRQVEAERDARGS